MMWRSGRLMVLLLAALRPAARSAPSVQTKWLGEPGKDALVTNLYDTGAEGWVAIGRPNAETVERINTPHATLIQRLPTSPFPASRTIRVTHDRYEDVGEGLMYGYDSIDDVCHIDVDGSCVYLINAAKAWVKRNGERVQPVSGNPDVYAVLADAGDRIRFLTKAWTPRAVKFRRGPATESAHPFPLKATTATQHDYAGTLRVLRGETGVLETNIARRTELPVVPSEYRLVADVPRGLSVTGAYGSGSKLIPVRDFPLAQTGTVRGGEPYARCQVSLEPFLSQLQGFLKRHRSYPQTHYIGWAAVCLCFQTASDAPAELPPLFWHIERDGHPGPSGKLTVRTHALGPSVQAPDRFEAHAVLRRFASAGPESLGVSRAAMLRKCGITAVATNSKGAALRAKKAGLRTAFFAPYNPGFGGVDIKGRTGRICTQKRILDGGDYYRSRLLEFGRDAPDAFDAYELDFEPRGTGTHEACFCEDCRRAFVAWCGSDISRMPAKQVWADHRKGWIAFRQGQYKEVFRIYRSAVRAIRPEYQVLVNAGGGPITDARELQRIANTAGFRIQDWDGFADLYSPYFYRNTSKFLPSLKLYQQTFKQTGVAPWTAVSFGVGGRGAHRLTPEHLRLQMFLWCAAGAPAIRLWSETETGLDGLLLTTIQRTLGELRRCEGYYANGQRADECVLVEGHRFGDAPGSLLDTGFRKWREIVQHTAHRRGHNLLVTLFNIDPDAEQRTARAKVAFPGLPADRRYAVSSQLTGEALLRREVLGLTLQAGIDVSVRPKDVLALHLRQQ